MIDLVESSSQEIGYIYIIKVLDYYKIGKTKNPSNRFGEYTKLMQEPEILLLKKVHNYHNLEKELHDLYNYKHVRGEWYLLNDDDVEYIRWYLEYFSPFTFQMITNMLWCDFLKTQIKNNFNNLIDVDEIKDNFCITLKTGDTLETKTLICEGKNIANSFGDIINSLSKADHMIKESLKIKEKLKSA